MNQQIHEVIMSLRRLSAVILPELKRLSSAIPTTASNAGIMNASTLETLLLDANLIAGAAVRVLAHVVNETDDSDVATVRKMPLPMDVELEVLRFCSRVDLDKLQLVSKGKRDFVDDMSDRLALHNIYRVNARAHRPGADESRCLVSYAAEPYSKGVVTDVLDETRPRDNDQNGLVPLERSPFRRMRNAFVGTAELFPPEQFMSEFKELLHAFISHHKGTMQVGAIKLAYCLSAQWLTYLLGIAAADLRAKCLVVTDYGDDGFVDRILAERTVCKARRITIDAHDRDEGLLGVAEIASLVDLATNCGDVRRIDVLLHGDHFAECLTQWIELPRALDEPIARLPKRKWAGMTFAESLAKWRTSKRSPFSRSETSSSR